MSGPGGSLGATVVDPFRPVPAGSVVLPAPPGVVDVGTGAFPFTRPVA